MLNIANRNDNLSVMSENNIKKIDTSFSRKKMHKILVSYYRNLEREFI
jgi:hypothetical protein